MRLSRQIAVLLSLVLFGLLPACGETWRPVTFVEGMRVLGVQAEPPDLNPGASTRLSALVYDPAAPTRKNLLLWVACDPDPLKLDQPLCAKYESLTNPAGLIAESGELPEGVHFVGLGEEASYSAPQDLFAPLPADSVHRTRGLVAIVILMAIATEPPAVFPPPEEEMLDLMIKVKLRQIPSVLSIKRIRITEESALNSNPAIEGARFDGELWGPGLRPVKLRPGRSYVLSGEAAAGAAERYTALDPDLRPVEKDEHLTFSWFSTLGDFDAPRTLAGDDSQRFTIAWPFDELPADRRGTMFLVLRDGRGGASWARRGLFVCDPFLEPPTIAEVEPPLVPPSGKVTIRGGNLAQVIDVKLGTGWLANVSYDAEEEKLTGVVPSETEPGPQSLVVRGKSCRDDPAVSYEVGTAP